MNRSSTAVPGCLTLALAALLPLASAQGEELRPAQQILETNRPLVIAHRGYSFLAPENTLPAFRLGLRAGADLIELDYHHTADGQLVVVHDPTLDRTTDAVSRWGRQKIGVASVRAAELGELDAGRWFAPELAGTRLPLLTEALDVIQGGGGVTLIERKAGSAEAAAVLLAKRDLVNRVVVQSFDWEYLKNFHQLQPRQILGALGPPGRLPDGSQTNRPKPLDATWLDLLQPSGARVVVWNREVSRPAIAAAHQRGLRVWVYTINEPALAVSLLDLGVDGIITDNPALIQGVVGTRRPK